MSDYMKNQGLVDATTGNRNRQRQLEAEIERLKSRAVWLYNQGYMAGYHDAVEGCYTDVLPVDADTDHGDVVADLLAELEDDDE